MTGEGRPYPVPPVVMTVSKAELGVWQKDGDHQGSRGGGGSLTQIGLCEPFELLLGEGLAVVGQKPLDVTCVDLLAGTHQPNGLESLEPWVQLEHSPASNGRDIDLEENGSHDAKGLGKVHRESGAGPVQVGNDTGILPPGLHEWGSDSAERGGDQPIGENGATCPV